MEDNKVKREQILVSTLCLGILFRIDEQTSGNVMKNLLFKATELGVNIEFEPIGDEEYEKWVDRQGKNRYILTIIGRGLSASQIAAATDVVTRQELNIDAIRRLTGRQSIVRRTCELVWSSHCVAIPATVRRCSAN